MSVTKIYTHKLNDIHNINICTHKNTFHSIIFLFLSMSLRFLIKINYI